MGALLPLLFLMFAFVTYYTNGKKITHAVIFPLLWCVIMLFESMHLFGLYKSSRETYAVIAIGVTSFLIGSAVCRRVVFSNSRSEVYSIRIGYYFLLSILTFALMLYPAIVNISALQLGDTSFTEIRQSFGNIYSSTLLKLLYNYIALPFSTACLPITAVIVFSDYDKRDKVYSILLTAVVVAEKIYIDAGRGIILYFFCMIFFAYKLLIPQKDRALKKKAKRYLTVLGIVAAVVYLSITYAREGAAVLRQFYVYICGCVPFLDLSIANFNRSQQYLFGAGGFHGITQLFFTTFDNLKIISYPAMAQLADDLYNKILVRQAIGSSLYFNAYATAFYNVYLDGGIFAVFLEMFLYGGISRCVYNRVIREPRNYRAKAVYIFLLYGILFSFIRFQFALSKNILAFIFIVLITKKEKQDNVSSSNQHSL